MSVDLAFPKIKAPAPSPGKAPPRKNCSEKLFLDILFIQLGKLGITLPCGCGCGQPLTRGNIRREHIGARELLLSGWDDADNQSSWRRDPCSLAKDKRDIRAIAKGKRIRKETKGSRKPKAKIKGGGFRNGRGSDLKSKFGGGVELRCKRTKS
jgi:hypothetical protein